LFHSFVATCLRKSPRRRPTALELMKHPFIDNCEDESVAALLELHSKLQDKNLDQNFDALVEKLETAKDPNELMQSQSDITHSTNLNISDITNRTDTFSLGSSEKSPENELSMSCNSVSSIEPEPTITSKNTLKITRDGNKATIHKEAARPVTVMVDATMRKAVFQRINQEKLVKFQLQEIRQLQLEHKK